MASLIQDAGGKRPTWRVQFTGPSRKRRTIRLGAMREAQARTFLAHAEALIGSRRCNEVPDSKTARWLAELPDELHDRLARVELVEPRVRVESVTLARMLTAFFGVVDVKPSTRIRMEQARTALEGHFGGNTPAKSIDEAGAEKWRASLREQKYAAATISRTTLYARQFWRWGVRRGMVDTNPFAEIRVGAQTNAARQAFIDRATIARVIDAAPDAEWRLLIVLSRFGGLRVPSEALALTWQDVDWEHSRLRVRSAKTEHHEGHGERFIPIFPEVKEHLQAVYDAAPEGSVYVIGRYREGQNLNPHFRRIIKRAGVSPWPRTWHNLRASRQTELAATFPLATACAWIGNTKAIAGGHYLQVTDSDWQRAIRPSGPERSPAPAPEAAHIPAHSGGADGRTDAPNPDPEAGNGAGNAGVRSDADGLVGRAGLEHRPVSSGKPHTGPGAGADSGASDPETTPDDDPERAGYIATIRAALPDLTTDALARMAAIAIAPDARSDRLSQSE